VRQGAVAFESKLTETEIVKPRIMKESEGLDWSICTF